MTQAELAAYVQAHLSRKGIPLVLSGGASVAIYSSDAYVSKDIDLVNVLSVKMGTIKSAMLDLGFREQGRYFIHPESDIPVEFPPGPLAVGSEPVKSIQELSVSTGILKVISPTDCVKDRLAAYYHWGDRQALEQALLVARQNQVDLADVDRWSRAEGKQKEFADFRRLLLHPASGI